MNIRDINSPQAGTYGCLTDETDHFQTASSLSHISLKDDALSDI